MDIWQAEYGKYNNFTSLSVLADLNGDFEVNDADVNVINQNFAMTGATRAQGDLNGDGNVNNLDMDLAFAQFGPDVEVVS